MGYQQAGFPHEFLICLHVLLRSLAHSLVLLASFVFASLSVMAERKDISEEVIDNISKFLPILRQPDIGLARAADYLEAWLAGTLHKEPPLSLCGCFG